MRDGPADLALHVPKNMGFHIGHRRRDVQGTVYLTTPDAHLVAIDARNGRLKWNVEIADYKKGFLVSNAPLVVAITDVRRLR